MSLLQLTVIPFCMCEVLVSGTTLMKDHIEMYLQ